jgi:type VI protein secretion system component Hcp
MDASKEKGLLLGALLAFLTIEHAFAQELQPIGTLAIPTVIEQPVSVFSAGLSYTITPPTGGGGAAPAASFSTFTLTKLADGTSPLLLVNAASGRSWPQARIDLFNSSASTVLTTYELSNILVLGAVVKNVQVGNAQTLIEEVSLDYQQIRQTVFTPAGPVQGCWDRVQNRAC